MSVIVATIPAKPEAPVNVFATKTEISVEWQEPDDGGSPIQEYLIYTDTGVGNAFVQVA